MATEMANNNDNKTLAKLINKFEKATQNDESVYFDIDEIVEIFDYYVDKKDTKKLRKIIDYGLKLYEDTYKILILEVKYQISVSNFAAAEKALKKAEKDEPENGEVDIIRAMTQIFQKKYEKAYLNIKKGMKKSGNEIDFMLLPLGMSFLEQKKYTEASVYLKKYLEFYPENSEILSEIAYAYFHDGRFIQALKYYQKHVDSFPYNENSWLQLARTYLKLKMPFEALDACNLALSINANSAIAYFEKGVIHLDEKKYIQAYSSFQEAMKLGLNNGSVHVNLGKIHLYLNESNDAKAEFEKSLEFLDTKKSDVHYLLALTHEMQLNFNQALLEINKAIDYQSDIELFMLHKAVILSKLNIFAEAEIIFKDILKRNNTEESAWLHLSDLYYQQNKIHEALEVLLASVLYIDNSFEIYSRITAYCLMLNKLIDAKSYFEKACHLDINALNTIVKLYPQSLKIDFIDNLYRQRDTI